MKLSTSSFSSPSSSSTLSFNPTTMSNSKSATAGCLTAILRRILCSGALPTHPSEQIRGLDSVVVCGDDQELKTNHKAKTTTTSTKLSSPGLVARLMGLEAMAEIPSESTPISISRSRSMNSVEECNRLQGLHRKVESTSSFREGPTFLLVENEDFLVCSFESGSESREFKFNRKKKEMASSELKLTRSERRGSEANKREKVSDESVLMDKGKLSKRVSDRSFGNVGSDGKLQEITNTWPQFKVSSENKCIDYSEKLKRRNKKTMCYTENIIEIECKSDDSSPVSVLDFERKAFGTVGMSSRRKLSPELQNDQQFHQRSDGNLMIKERKFKTIENNKYEGSKKRDKHSQEHIDIWGDICSLAEEGLAQSNQLHARMKKQGDFVSADFESQIFDQLLNELIDQLLGQPPSIENFAT